jgi:methionyl-tRNA formyltransferase
LRGIVQSAHEVVAVVTRPDGRTGRGQRVAESAVSQAANEFGIPVLKPSSPREPSFEEDLSRFQADAAAVVAYGGLLPAAVLGIPRHGWINLHFSLLPAWRGAAPVQHAIWHGDQITGATTFRIVEELDAGPVFGMMTYQISPAATSGEVLRNLADDGAKLLLTTLDLIATGQARPEAQSTDGVSYAAKISAGDAAVDWTAPAQSVDRQIRACTPSPGARTLFRGERLKIWPVSLAASGTDRVLGTPPGAIRLTKHSVFAGTGSGEVVLGDISPAGKARMDAASWARGVRIEDGERLG